MGKIKKINFLLILVIFIGTFFTSMTMIRSGQNFDFGLGFWGPNGHDAIWHLSLINQLKENVPPQNPIYAGEMLSNYHWGFDLVAALVSKLIGISALDVYFRILPLLFAVSLGFLSYKLAILVTKDQKTSLYFVFLNYFAGSFGWIITLINNRSIGGESLFWSMQSISTLLNPPYAFSLIILLLGLILWWQKKDTESLKWAFIIGLIFGLLACIKVYSGILIGLSISIFWLLNLIKTRKFSKFNFFVCLFTGLISLSILILLGAIGKNNVLEFKPFWFVNSMIESVDKLFIPKLATLRYNLSHQLLSYKLPFYLALEVALLLIFLVGNMGTRIFGLFTLIKRHFTKKINDFDGLISIFLLISFTIPLLFIQKGTAWNTIQFFYYFLFFSNIYFAQFLSRLFSKNNTGKFLVALLLVITIPTSYATIKDYFGFPPPASIPKYELEALSFLKNQDYGYVLTYPYDKYKKNNINTTPIPIYLYETTSYVSAMTQKPTFLEDEMNLDITGFNWKERRLQEMNFFNSKDKFQARGFLLDNKIDYIYLVNDQKLSLSPFDLQIDKIFENQNIQIYKVRK